MALRHTIARRRHLASSIISRCCNPCFQVAAWCCHCPLDSYAPVCIQFVSAMFEYGLAMSSNQTMRLLPRRPTLVNGTVLMCLKQVPPHATNHVTADVTVSVAVGPWLLAVTTQNDYPAVILCSTCMSDLLYLHWVTATVISDAMLS